MQLRWTALWEPWEVGVKMEEWDLITRWMWSIIGPGMRCVREDVVITRTHIYLFLLNLHHDQAIKCKEWHSLMPSFTPFYKHVVYTQILSYHKYQWLFRICQQRADGGKGDMHSSMSVWASPCKSVRDDVSSVAQLFDMQKAFLCKCVWTASDTAQSSGTKAQVYQGKKDKAKYKNRMKISEWKNNGVWHLWHFSPTCPFYHQDAGLISWSSPTMCWTDTKEQPLFSFKWMVSKHVENVSIKTISPDSVFCSLFLLLRVCKSYPPSPSFQWWILKCELALILHALLSVVQACSRHDSHCGVSLIVSVK